MESLSLYELGRLIRRTLNQGLPDAYWVQAELSEVREAYNGHCYILLIDGNKFNPYPGVTHTTVVKGDATYMSIAAASILAKTYRDDYMQRLAEEYPQYDWSSNKGYPTSKHRAAIREYGPTPYHRMSFNLLGEEPRQLSFDFGE